MCELAPFALVILCFVWSGMRREKKLYQYIEESNIMMQSINER